MSFRGINTTVIQIRRQVFTEVARMAYANVKGEQANHLMRKIPYTIIPGEEGKLRKDIFLERAIVEERVRLAMGLPTRRMDEHNSVVSGLEDASIADKYYDPPLVNVIKFACNRCPEKLVKVSDLCQGCLAHPCMEVCPKKAITWESGPNKQAHPNYSFGGKLMEKDLEYVQHFNHKFAQREPKACLQKASVYDNFIFLRSRGSAVSSNPHNRHIAEISPSHSVNMTLFDA